MIVGEEVRAFVRARLDDPSTVGKIEAARVGVHRNTLLRLVRLGVASSLTMRRLSSAYPNLPSATCANSVEPITA